MLPPANLQNHKKIAKKDIYFTEIMVHMDGDDLSYYMCVQLDNVMCPCMHLKMYTCSCLVGGFNVTRFPFSPFSATDPFVRGHMMKPSKNHFINTPYILKQ